MSGRLIMNDRPFGNHEMTSRQTLSSFRIVMRRSGNNSLLPDELVIPAMLVSLSILKMGTFDISPRLVFMELDVWSMLRFERSSTTIGAVEQDEKVASAVAASTRLVRPCGPSSE
jgi:hypothetical protein